MAQLKAAYKNANNLHLDRHSDRQTDRRTHSQAVGQTDRQTVGWTKEEKLSCDLSRPKYTVARLVSSTAIKASPAQAGSVKDSKEGRR